MPGGVSLAIFQDEDDDFGSWHRRLLQRHVRANRAVATAVAIPVHSSITAGVLGVISFAKVQTSD